MFYKRLDVEPRDRQNIRICDFADVVPNIGSGYLLEDIQLGLCGVVCKMWNISFQQRDTSHETNGHLDLLFDRLEAWKACLDMIRRELSTTLEERGPNDSRLLRAYAGREELFTEPPQYYIERRIQSLCLSVSMLYRISSIRLHLKAAMGKHTVAECEGLPPWRVETQVCMLIAGTSSEGMTRVRWAMWHSFQILRECELAMKEPNRGVGVIDPLSQMALGLGESVVRSWYLYSSNTPCNDNACMAASAPLLDWNAATDRDCWLEHGGILGVDGTPTCHCWVDTWLSRFLSLLV